MSVPNGDPIAGAVQLARNTLDGGFTTVYQDALVTIKQGWQAHFISALNSNYFGTSTPFDACQAVNYGRGQYDMRPLTSVKWINPSSSSTGAGRFTLLAAGDEYYCEWNQATIGVQSELYLRFYFRIISMPLTGTVILAEWADTEGVITNRLAIDPTGALLLGAFDAADDVIGVTGDYGYALSEDTWYRLEARLRFSPTTGDGTEGALSAFYVFAGDERTYLTGDEQWYANADTERCDRFRFGVFGTPMFPTLDDSIVIHYDDVVIGAVGWIGIQAEAVSAPDVALAVDTEVLEISGQVDITEADTATATDSAVAIVEKADSDDATTVDTEELDAGGLDLYVFDTAAFDDYANYEDA